MRNISRAVLLWFILQPAAVVESSASEQSGEEREESQEEAGQIQLPDYEVLVEDSVSYIPRLSSVTARLPVPIFSTPASVEVVTAPLLERQNATYLGEALHNVSGVVPHSGFGVFDFFTIRGFDSLTSGLVLSDGIPEPESTYYQLYNVERIEVLKGPGASLYGGNSMAGSINLIRKQPLPKNALQVTGSFGSFETYRGGLDFNRASADGNLAFRLNLFGQHSGHFRDDKDSRQLGINPSVTWTLGQRTSFTADLEYLDIEYQPDVGIPLLNNQVPDVPETRSYQSPLDFSNQEIYRFRFDINTSLTNSISIRNRTYLTKLDWQSDGTLFGGVFPGQTSELEVNRILTQLDDTQTVAGNQLEGLFLFSTGGISHSLLTGLEVTRWGDDFVLDAALLPGIDLFNPVETATSQTLFPIPGQSERGDVQTWVFAPYVVDRIRFSPHWEALVGGRLDVLDTEENLSSFSRNDTRFSPLLGLSYLPFSDLVLYANFGDAFAPPSSRVIGERRPEESRQYEAGLKKQFFQGKLRSTLAFYHLERTNIAIPDNFGMLRQTGSQRSRGVEVTLSGEPQPGWYTIGSYAFTDSELTEYRELIADPFDPTSFFVLDHSGNRPGFVPRHLLKIWTLREFQGGWTIGGGGQYVGPQFIAEDNAFSLDRYVLFDAVVMYHIDNWRWSLNFKNLTDRTYYTRGFGSTSVLPASPFGLVGRIDLIM